MSQSQNEHIYELLRVILAEVRALKLTVQGLVMSQADENAALTSIDADLATFQATNSKLLAQLEAGQSPDDSAIIAHLKAIDTLVQGMNAAEAGQLQSSQGVTTGTAPSAPPVDPVVAGNAATGSGTAATGAGSPETGTVGAQEAAGVKPGS